jgi:folate-binding protein YgfZ
MLEVTAFDSFVPVLVNGSDALAFLQGQLTADLRQLGPTRALFGAACNAQGRVQTVVTLLERREGMVLLLQQAFAERTVARFRAIALSAKVSFELVPWGVAALFPDAATSAGHELPAQPGTCMTAGDVTWLRFWGPEERHLVIAPDPALRALTGETPDLACAWRRSDVMSGLPRIHAATQNSFVPQMINLDVLGGVSFDKGCYVGQEVVARARRGGVSRRMFGFSAACEPAAPGTEVLSLEGVVTGAVVDAVSSPTGSSLLAVVDLDQASAALSLRDLAHSELTLAPLPYAVPVERPARTGRAGLAQPDAR